MTNCLDITNLATAKLEKLLKDLLSGDITFDDAVKDVGGITITIEEGKE
jgi:hypothetical protein